MLLHILQCIGRPPPPSIIQTQMSMCWGRGTVHYWINVKSCLALWIELSLTWKEASSYHKFPSYFLWIVSVFKYNVKSFASGEMRKSGLFKLFNAARIPFILNKILLLLLEWHIIVFKSEKIWLYVISRDFKIYDQHELCYWKVFT